MNLFKNHINVNRDKDIINIGEGIVLSESDDNEKDLKIWQCKKMLYDKMTDLVSSEKVFTDNTMDYIYKFQSIVIKLIDGMINDYRNKNNIDEKDLFFIYKGGTVMKILYDKYKLKIKNNGLDKFFSNYNKSFSRSDSDYSVMINPYLDNHIKHYLEVNKIVYSCLINIRDIFENDNNNIIPLNNLTNDVMINKIREINDILNNTKENIGDFPLCDNLRHINNIIGIGWKNGHIMSEEITNIYYDNTEKDNEDDIIQVNRTLLFKKNGIVPIQKIDYALTYDNKNRRILLPLVNNGSNSIYLSVNETNEYYSEKSNTKFMLQRLKLNFVLYYKTKDGEYGYMDCPSELVDVSIPKSGDTGMIHLYEHGNKHIFDKFRIYKYMNEGKKLEFRSYTIYGFMMDLIGILFIQNDYPWIDKKYGKRINRLLFFMFMELSLYTSGNDIIYTIYKLLKKIFEKSVSILMNIDNKNNLLDELQDNIIILENIKLKNNNKLGTIEFLRNIKKIIEKITEDDVPKFVEMSKIINNQLKLIDENINTTKLSENETIINEGNIEIGRAHV